MRTMAGGTLVGNGYYWNVARWELVPVRRDGEALPGGRGDRYLRVPLPLVFALLPVMGGLLVVFLPFIGFVLTAQAAARPLVAAARGSARALAATVSPGWQPGEAHFTGKRAEPAHRETRGPTIEDTLDRLQREIDERRRAQG